jgi:acetylornithine deacetylase
MPLAPGDVRTDLEALVAFDTVSHRSNEALAAWVAQRCEDLGFSIHPFVDPDHPHKRSLICRVGPSDTDGIVLSGHMDVVPTEGQPWASDPFTLTERDGRLVGRGSADMKGFFAATLRALEQLDLRTLSREIVLVWTHDEEVGCLGAGKLVDHLAAAGVRMPSACLIGEPTDFQILRMHPGHVVVELRITGTAAHSSRPDLGLNALEDAARAVLAARRVADQLQSERADLPGMERPWVAFNTASLQSGSAVNIVPDQAVVRFGYRPLPGMAPDEVHGRLVEAFEALQLRCAWEATIERVTPSMLTPDGTPLQGLLADHVRHHAVGACSFATDGGQLERLGLQPLVFGPGSIEVAHKADEYVLEADLRHAVDVLADVVRRRCG